MIIGAHSIIYSTNPDADRAFFRDILKLTHIDVGEGWLIFGLPPAELAVHPSNQNQLHEFYFMVKDILTFVESMKVHHIICDTIQNQGWGLLTRITLPGGGQIGVYQPRHPRPKPMSLPSVSKKRVKAATTTRPKAPAKKLRRK